MEQTKQLNEAYTEAKSFCELTALCPYCETESTFIHLRSSMIKGNFRRDDCKLRGSGVHMGRCKKCHGGVIGISEDNDTFLAFPRGRAVAMTPAGIDEFSLRNYQEAVAVLPHSASAAGMLARQSLIRMLRSELKVEWTKLGFQIEEAVQSDRITDLTRNGLLNLIRYEIIGPHLSRDTAKKRRRDPALMLLETNERDARYTIKVLEMVIHDLFVNNRTGAVDGVGAPHGLIDPRYQLDLFERCDDLELVDAGEREVQRPLAAA